MPLAIPCDELEPGMQLAESIISKGVVQLPARIPLRAPEIRTLRRRFPNITVRVIDPFLDEAIEFQDDAQDRRVGTRVQTKIAKCMADVQNRYGGRAAVGGGEIDFHKARAAVDEVIGFLKNNSVSSALLTRCVDSDNLLAVRTGNVFYLSMLLGSALRDYVAEERKRQTVARLNAKQLEDLTPLGLGAMFADVGMVPLVPLLRLDRSLSGAEQEMIREHPATGAAALPEQFPILARIVIKNHHENYDGTGYPNHLDGASLHVFPRIVRIADAFDATTGDSVLGEGKSPVRALWEMSIGTHRRFYDPVMMEVFPKVIQPFPIGAKIRLVDGRFAVVVRHVHEFPFAPIVVVAFDSKNQRLPRIEGPAQLHESGLLAKSFRNEDLSFLYWTSFDPAPPSLKFRTMAEAWYP